jgi:two-component system, NarL family, response regulator NreC
VTARGSGGSSWFRIDFFTRLWLEFLRKLVAGLLAATLSHPIHSERSLLLAPDILATSTQILLREVKSEMPTRMVLASDDTIMRAGLRSLFREIPDVEIVGEAETLIEAPEKVRELAPDVALIEVSVPSRTHGLRAVADIASRLAGVRLLILTNNSDLPYVRSMLAAGASGYLLKSCNTLQLVAAVRTLKSGGKFIDPTLGDDLVWRALDRNVKKPGPVFSQREWQIFGALVRGYTNLQSANTLRLSVKTVETYRLRIYRKLQLRTRAELVEYALAHRLLNENDKAS